PVGRRPGALRRPAWLPGADPSRLDPGHPGPEVAPGPAEPGVAPGRRTRRPFTVRRAVGWLVLGLIAWVAFSGVVFVISAQLAPGIPSQAKAALSSSGWPLTSANTILVLGSDQRT